MYDNWHTLTLAEQLGNVGSDYDQALRWKEKKQQKLQDSALARALDQLDLTLADTRWTGSRRREIARLRDEVCSEIMYQDNPQLAARLQTYFLKMAALARK